MPADSLPVSLAEISSGAWGVCGLLVMASQTLPWEGSNRGVWLGRTKRECGNPMLDSIMSPMMC